MKKLIGIIGLSIVCGNTFAGNTTVTTKIDKLYSYAEQGIFDGDIAILISNPPVGCEGGYWLRKADTLGYKNTLSFLLSAFHSQTTVSLSGNNNELWSGSSNKYCRLDQIALMK
ncbi:hypothetical protein [Aliikangiella sp. IMCC44359]|uniref:hypothetical protein n=1 Tax=Aliikangiella sp. IMCC44359 TaxID=3459125 RepID=UPI00403B09AB